MSAAPESLECQCSVRPGLFSAAAEVELQHQTSAALPVAPPWASLWAPAYGWAVAALTPFVLPPSFLPAHACKESAALALLRRSLSPFTVLCS